MFNVQTKLEVIIVLTACGHDRLKKVAAVKLVAVPVSLP